MSLVTGKFRRKPFEIEAIQVTEENMVDVAKWCGGEIISEKGRRFIKVDVKNPLTDKQTKGYVGDWVLKAFSGFKVYTHKAFVACFDQVIERVEIRELSLDDQPTLFEEEKPKPKIHFPTNYPEPSAR